MEKIQRLILTIKDERSLKEPSLTDLIQAVKDGYKIEIEEGNGEQNIIITNAKEEDRKIAEKEDEISHRLLRVLTTKLKELSLMAKLMSFAVDLYAKEKEEDIDEQDEEESCCNEKDECCSNDEEYEDEDCCNEDECEDECDVDDDYCDCCPDCADDCDDCLHNECYDGCGSTCCVDKDEKIRQELRRQDRKAILERAKEEYRAKKEKELLDDLGKLEEQLKDLQKELKND